VTIAAQNRDLHFVWAYNQPAMDPEAVIGKPDFDLFEPEDAKRLTALKRNFFIVLGIALLLGAAAAYALAAVFRAPWMP